MIIFWCEKGLNIITIKGSSRTNCKVAPYSFMTARALMIRALVIYARSHENVYYRFFLIFYDVSIARKSKVNSGFSRVFFGEFF